MMAVSGTKGDIEARRRVLSLLGFLVTVIMMTITSVTKPTTSGSLHLQVEHMRVLRSRGKSTSNSTSSSSTSIPVPGPDLPAYDLFWDASVCEDQSAFSSFLATNRRKALDPMQHSNYDKDHTTTPIPTPSACVGENWVVMSDVHKLSDEVVSSLLASPLQPCIVIVALNSGINFPPSTLSTELASNSKVIFLGEEAQQGLGYAIAKELPWGHLSRKNIGYLYAIQNGAKTLLDTEGSLMPLPDQASRLAPHKILDVQEVYPMHRLFNPYSLAGLDDRRPRGMPVIDASNPNSRVRDGKNLMANLPWVYPQQNMEILHSLITTYPDLAASQLTDDGESLSPPRDVDQFSSWSVPRNTFIPYNAVSTIHRHKAFFGLMLPSTVPTSLSDVTRGYVTQRLLWEVGGQVAVTGPWGTRSNPMDSTSNTTLSQLIKEEQGFECKIQALLDYLGEVWEPDGKPLPAMMDAIYGHLYEMGVVDAVDVRLNRLWTQDLQRLGYGMPEVPPLIVTPALASGAAQRFALGIQG